MSERGRGGGVGRKGDGEGIRGMEDVGEGRWEGWGEGEGKVGGGRGVQRVNWR